MVLNQNEIDRLEEYVLTNIFRHECKNIKRMCDSCKIKSKIKILQLLNDNTIEALNNLGIHSYITFSYNIESPESSNEIYPAI